MRDKMIAVSLLWITVSLAFFSCDGKNNKGELWGSGQIEGTDVQVSPLVAGRITVLAVDRGDVVKAGDPIAELDSSDYALMLQQVRAQLAEAQQRLGLLIEGPRKEDILQAMEQVKQAEAQREDAKINLTRVEEVFRRGSASARQMDDAKTRIKVAEAAFEAARQAYERLLHGSRKQEIGAASAAVDALKAQVAQNEKYIADCTVVSPISGTVTHKVREAGEYVGKGAPIATITKLDPVDLIIYLPEKVLGRVRLGQKADVVIDTYPDKNFTGKVTFISPQAEFTPRDIQTKEDRVKLVYEVKIEIANPEGVFKPGMPAEATLVEP
jgi:HlyD family secretion protein